MGFLGLCVQLCCQSACVIAPKSQKKATKTTSSSTPVGVRLTCGPSSGLGYPPSALGACALKRNPASHVPLSPSR